MVDLTTLNKTQILVYCVLSLRDKLQSVNIFSANNVATLCTVGLLILRLLNCITDTIQVTDGRERFP